MRRLGGVLRSVLAAVVLTALVAACSGSSESDASSSTTERDGAASTLAGGEGESTESTVAADESPLTMGLVGIRTLDPLGSSPASVSQMVLADLLYDTLSELDDDGAVQSGLATFAANADRTVWRFELTDQASFDDGQPITADDVVFSLERVRSQGNASLAALQLEGVQQIVAVDARTVDVHLTEPSAVLPELLSSPLFGIVSRARTEQGAQRGSLVPLGSGDFAVTVDSDHRVVLDRRRGDGPAQVVLELFDDRAAAMEAYGAGTVDWTPGPVGSSTDVGDRAAPEDFAPFDGTVLLAINPQVPPLSDKRLRQAIALAIDRGPLTDAVFGPEAQPLLGLMPEGVAGAAASCMAPCGPDPDAARALVAQVFPDGQQRPLRLLVDDSESQQAIAGVLEEQLDAVGLDVETSSLDPATVDQLIRSGQQQLFLFSTLAVARTPASHLAPLFRAESPDNVTGYDNQLVDAAIALALDEPIATQRAARWREIEAAILDDAPVVPLVQLRTGMAVSARARGLRLRVDGSIDLSGVDPVDDGG